MIISLWKWAYTRFISNPQVVADLYVEECDDINNALQCCACYATVPPEYAICPNCKAQKGMEMVWAPGIEEDGGDIAFELNSEDLKRPLKPLWAAHLYQSELESYVANWSDVELQEAHEEFARDPQHSNEITYYPTMERTFEGEDVFCAVEAELQKREVLQKQVGTITSVEYERVLAGREQQRAAQAWEETKRHHDPAECDKYIECEMCVEIEHDRMIESGGISVE